MSIFKDTFRGYVRNQLEVREELISIGNPDKFNEHKGNTNRKNSSHTFTNWNKEEVTIKPGAHHTYSLNKQCVIRATSLVDYVSDVGLDIGNLGEQSFDRLKGASLSQNFILQGGILSDFARSFQTTDENGNPQGLRKVRKLDQVRASFQKPGLKTNIAYGDFAIGADASEDGYGIVPMPGIIDATIRTKSAYGSLREGKINFEVHNQRQLEIMEMLYMRPGYMVLLEWGWCPYIASSGGKEERGKIVNELRLVENETDNDIYTNNITQDRVYNAINNLKESQDGNYDGMLGFVKNFGFKAREDGGYSCFTELTSIGEVIESIKIPAVSIVNTSKDINPSGNTTTDGGGDIVVKGGVAYNTNNLTSDQKTQIQRDTLKVDRVKFDKAIATKVYPTYNGLLGLINVINNYCVYGFPRFDSGGVNQQNLSQGRRVSEAFEFVDKLENDSRVKKEGLSKEEIAAIDKSKSNLKVITNRHIMNKAFINSFLRNLLTFQSADFESLLFKKFGMDSKTEIKDYLIPIGKDTVRTVDGEYVYGVSNQPYIRWDALSILINDYLIPKNEKGINPLKIATDRLYDIDKDICGLDPLLFCPITSYQSSTEDNMLLDFSCDANVCILPLQFDQNLAPEASSDADPLHIAQTLGYIPDLSKFPVDNIASMYGYSESNKSHDLKYNNSLYNYDNNETLNNLPLSDTDKLRRIGNIFLNVTMLLDIAEKNADNESYSVGQFIKDIFEKVNKVCPNHNFVLTDDKESNNIFIIDLPVDNSEIPMDLHIFEPFSNKNILRNFDYTSNVPSAMSATIAIQAQDPRSMQDIDGVTFAAFNRSIKNRLLSKDAESTFEKTLKDINTEGSKIISQQSTLLNQLITYRSNFFRNLPSANFEGADFGKGNIMGSLKTYQKNSSYLSTIDRGVNSFNSVIPLEFSATLDGISGMVIGNIFKIHKDRLPKAYHKSNIGFILFNEEQKITAGGDWTTDISGKMTILPEAPLKIKGTAVQLPEGVESTAPIESESGGAFTAGSESDTDITQELVTDINKATTNSNLYLKWTKDPSLLKIDDRNVSGRYDWHGYTSLRGDRGNGPYIDNESGYGTSDNVYGMFDSYNNPGMYLGKVKSSKQYQGDPNYDADTSRYLEKYRFKQLRILNKYAHLYFKDVSPEDDQSIGYIFSYKEEQTPADHGREDDPYTYYIPNSSNVMAGFNVVEFNDEAMTKGIRGGTGAPYYTDGDVTGIVYTWFSVEFDSSVDSEFKKNWVREDTEIDTDGGNFGNYLGSNTLSQYTRGDNKDIWMRSDTVAITKESATQLFIKEPPREIPLSERLSGDSQLHSIHLNYNIYTSTSILGEDEYGVPYNSYNYTQLVMLEFANRENPNWANENIITTYSLSDNSVRSGRYFPKFDITLPSDDTIVLSSHFRYENVNRLRVNIQKAVAKIEEYEETGNFDGPVD